MAGKHTINGRHPMALQAELKAKMAALPPEKPAPPKPAPPKPVAPAPVAVAPPSLSLKEKLETLPDEGLLLLADDNGLPATNDRNALIDALVEKGITL